MGALSKTGKSGIPELPGVKPRVLDIRDQDSLIVASHFGAMTENALRPWVLRGGDRGTEDFPTLDAAVAAIDTFDLAFCGVVDGPNGVRFHADELTRHRKGLKPITL